MRGVRSKPLLYVIAVGLGLAAVAVPLLLHRMPLPLRLVAGFTNLLAAFAVAMVIRQSSQPKEPAAEHSRK